MAEYTISKIIKNGDEYSFGGGGGGVTKAIFGDGSDGNCTIQYDASTCGNVFMKAQTYNFCNFTICEGVKLRFCGNGVPILRVKNCFINNGDIELRNPLINCNAQYAEPYLKTTLCSDLNNLYDCASLLAEEITLENLQSRVACGGPSFVRNLGGNGRRGGCGGAGGSITTSATNGKNYANEDCTSGNGAGGLAGSSQYPNAAGGGGGSGHCYYSGNSFNTYYGSGCKGCDAPGDGIGGDGGNGGNADGSVCTSGGGGGYGYCQGGNGGGSVWSSYANRGDGGNSYLGKGGDGGNKGGCSYYGNGGTGTYGGSTIFGNGGDGTHPRGCTTYGGWSLYGNGGTGTNPGFGMNSAKAWGGIYDIGIFAKDFKNEGNINGNGYKGSCCGGTRGSGIYMVYNAYTSIGNINYCGCGCTDGFLCTCQL